jgi:hypothetical protein
VKLHITGNVRSGKLLHDNEGNDKVVPLLNQLPRHEDVWGSGGIAPCVINHDIRCEWSASSPVALPPGK